MYVVCRKSVFVPLIFHIMFIVRMLAYVLMIKWKGQHVHSNQITNQCNAMCFW